MEKESLQDFGTRIKEEGIDYKTIIINPSLLPKFENEKQDILDFIREYSDRIKWSQFLLHEWLIKYDFIREFREHYDDKSNEYFW